MPDSSAALATPTAPPNLPERTVSELASDIKHTMETRFDRVRVRGELGRVTIAKSGHIYADLKDANACLSLVMWRGAAAALRFKPEEGLEVIAEGRITTFPGKSQYQLVADRLEPSGEGALLLQLERLKARLASEGLFARERKRPIPFLPRTIGVVTSPTGAVIRDILHRLEERFPRRVLLWPVQVQGVGAKEQIARAIEGFNRLEGALRPDVLIVARGGGSIEDLWAFNEEIVVRAAAGSAIPLISAVGHETDTTLIDHAADRRAPTPTAAAEMAVPVRAELLERVGGAGLRLSASLARGLDGRRAEVRAAAARLPRPDALLGMPAQRFDRVAEGLDRALRTAVRDAGARLAHVSALLRPDALRQDTARKAHRLDDLQGRLGRALAGNTRGATQRAAAVTMRLRPEALGVEARAAALASLGRLLETLSHRSVLARGFALVTDAEGTVVRAAAAIEPGAPLTLTFADGQTPAIAAGTPQPRRKRRPGDSPNDRPNQGDLF